MKRHYRMGQCKIASRPEVENNVKDDEEVQFWWDTLCAILDIEDETSQALLEVLVSFYVPFRGFAFTSRWMEKYKQQSRKSIQNHAAYATNCSSLPIKYFLCTYPLYSNL